jgi:hypothetical protein
VLHITSPWVVIDKPKIVCNDLSFSPDAVAKSPTPVSWLVVAAEPVTSVDVTAADALAELDKALHGMGIEFWASTRRAKSAKGPGLSVPCRGRQHGDPRQFQRSARGRRHKKKSSD